MIDSLQIPDRYTILHIFSLKTQPCSLERGGDRTEVCVLWEHLPFLTYSCMATAAVRSWSWGTAFSETAVRVRVLVLAAQRSHFSGLCNAIPARVPSHVRTDRERCCD